MPSHRGALSASRRIISIRRARRFWGINMLRHLRKKNLAQSIIEYAVLIAVLAAAFTAMFVYFKRAINARLEDLRQEYNPQAQ